jgi:general secretion pathway protein A
MLEFYGLREHPFGVSPNPRFLYPSVQHREAIASLIFGIENQVGFAALVAEPGTGKTTLLFDILQRYRERASTAFVFNTQCCSGHDLLRQVVMELQIPGGDSERDPIQLHQLFTAFVADRLRTKPVVLIIDEAQNLENSALETLRLLSNFEAADHKLLHIILAGQPQLGVKLRSPSLTQLLQRITTIGRLDRFSPAQIQECIEFRLRVAGGTGPPPFTTEAMAKIMTASGGVPREINRICINAMQLGFALRQKKISVEVIEEVLSDLFLSRGPQAETSKEGPAIEPQLAGIEEKAPSPLPKPKVSSTPAEPIIPRIFDEPWASNTPIESSCMGVLPLREERKDSSGDDHQKRPAAEVSKPKLVEEEGEAPVSSRVKFPYTFAMGCVPRPVQVSAEVRTASRATVKRAVPSYTVRTDGVA